MRYPITQNYLDDAISLFNAPNQAKNIFANHLITESFECHIELSHLSLFTNTYANHLIISLAINTENKLIYYFQSVDPENTDSPGNYYLYNQNTGFVVANQTTATNNINKYTNGVLPDLDALKNHPNGTDKNTRAVFIHHSDMLQFSEIMGVKSLRMNLLQLPEVLIDHELSTNAMSTVNPDLINHINLFCFALDQEEKVIETGGSPNFVSYDLNRPCPPRCDFI